jgi:hypothetical protein
MVQVCICMRLLTKFNRKKNNTLVKFIVHGCCPSAGAYKQTQLLHWRPVDAQATCREHGIDLVRKTKGPLHDEGMLILSVYACGNLRRADVSKNSIHGSR